ncbi:lytic polysaccharide monooxygenase [Microbispora sp. NEAU-D428]|uniref:lytic polysaccharide monooxygenase n=1 Tax=Microbispora sitophila TaxID=2771537 RepID=UPI001865E385|nr:lytic polysaccharide monooxygenase [Microbispora sitophila]MBE3011830.1 lytic polysaccharide monooxygenase [Microbispora sitophila]
MICRAWRATASRSACQSPSGCGRSYSAPRQAVGWNDLQSLTKTGKYALGQYYSVDLSTSGRSGRAVVYTIWQASHMDQTFFFCSDVNFTG